MAKANSYDLRQKVNQSLELDGWKKSEACRQYLKLTENTIGLWLKRRRETEDYHLPYKIKSLTPFHLSTARSFYLKLIIKYASANTFGKLINRWLKQI